MDKEQAQEIIKKAQEIAPKGNVAAIQQGEYVELRNDPPSMVSEWVENGWTTYTGTGSSGVC